MPPWLPAKGWCIDRKGYLFYASRGTYAGIPRGKKVHRAVMERLAGGPIPEDKHVHHSDWDKLNNCWRNLILMDSFFNPQFALRDPYTGHYMSPTDWHRRYGYGERMTNAQEMEVPDWVATIPIEDFAEIAYVE